MLTDADHALAGTVVDGLALTAADVARFRSLCPEGVPDETCWLWKGRPNANGYGRMHVGGRRGRQILANRIALVLLGRAALHPDQVARHTCDTTLCVNPRHLLPGSQRDNVADAVARSRIAAGDAHGLRQHPERRASGERHGRRKLSLADAMAIRNAEATDVAALRRLAAQHGVRVETIREIRRGASWATAVGDVGTKGVAARPKIPAAMRAEVVERDAGVCGICGKLVSDSFHLDHAESLANGGRTVASNLQVAHPSCNGRKGRRSARPRRAA